jgi:hypothetical protein
MHPALGRFLINSTKFTPLSRSMLRPDKVALIQTDGSFSKGNISRTAVTLNTPNNMNYTFMNTYFDHLNSTESEWCSVLDGILFAEKKNQGAIELENDCLPVIRHLIIKKPPVQSYLQGYYHTILIELKAMDYVGVRWIPREINKADVLFRIE